MAESKPLYIVDSSVALKWYFAETDAQAQALALLDDFAQGKVHIITQHYCFAEMLNLMGRVHAPDKAASLFSHFLNLQISHFPVTLEVAFLALTLMHKLRGVSFYDTGYHALALHHGGIFVTADAKYFRKAHKRGNVMLLKDYGKKR